MRYDEYRSHDAVGLAKLVKERVIHPREILAAALQRHRDVNPKINATSLMMEDAAIARAGSPLSGPLAGVPFLIKDLLQDLAGYPTSGGTGPLRAVTAQESSEAVRRWLAAGLVIFGKTTTSEFGSKPVTESPTYGATRNPWNLARTPGGSSGGAAAAVAAGIVPAAGASDGGGSIRIPAACTGLVGLKAGRGVVPAGPRFGEYVHGAGTEGVVTRTVRDSAAMLDILAAPYPGAPYAAPVTDRPYTDAVGQSPPTLRIGVIVDSPLGTDVDSELVDAVWTVAYLLEGLGHQIEVAGLGVDGAAMAHDFMTVWTAHIGAEIDDACARTGADPADFDIDNRVMAAIGNFTSATRLVDAFERWNRYTRTLTEFHAHYDLLLTPTLGQKPLLIGQNATPLSLRVALSALLRLGLGGVISRAPMYRSLVTETFAAAPFPLLANVTGRPAISVPASMSTDGLPLGVHFTGPLSSEFLLLQVAAQLETASPWVHQEPLAIAAT